MQRLPRAYYQTRAGKDRNLLFANETSIEDALKTNRVSDIQTTIDVKDAEKDQSLVQGLDYPTWLPFAAKTYNISPRIEDYIIVYTVICPSELPNRNGIAFPTSELVKFQPPPVNRMVYKAWAGCPVHYEHANEIHTDAYGVILDASFHKVKGYGGGKLWKVMGVLAIDKQKNPEMARRVLAKEVNTYSMGALVDEFKCGFCGTECTKHHVCPHISSISNVNWDVQKSWDGTQHLSFLNAYGINPIECSIVEDPAWAPALSDEVFEIDNSVRPWENKDSGSGKSHKSVFDGSASIFDGFPGWK